MNAHQEPAVPLLNVIGAGRVGKVLARLWHLQGVFSIQDVLTTSMFSAQAACAFIGEGRAVDTVGAIRPANVWMMAVPDAALGDCARILAGAAPQAQSATQPIARSTGADDPDVPTVFHCSGAQASSVLQPLAALGWHTASAHCILSFASPQAALQQFPGTPCALESIGNTCDDLRVAFEAIGARCFGISGQDKLLYHAAAVFATNFLPVLQATAEDLWRSTGMPADLIPHLRETLLRNAVTNITTLGPQAALTGPSARGDTAAIARQGAAVSEWDAQTGAAYDALSRLALRLAGRKAG